MIEVIRQQFREGQSQEARVNITREFLQLLCLKVMSDRRMFDGLSFLGGTALRILHGLRRYSEDLDFSVVGGKCPDMQAVLTYFTGDFARFGLSCEAKARSVGTVQSIALRFPVILKSLGLSALADQKLMIKWDVDTNPPAGADTEYSILSRQSRRGRPTSSADTRRQHTEARS